MKAAGAVGAAAFAGITQATPGREPGSYDPEKELVVGRTQGVSMASAQANVQSALPASSNVTFEEDTLGYFTVEAPDWMGNVSADSWFADRIRNQAGVQYVHENEIRETQSADPKYNQQYAPQQVRADTAWDTTLGSEDVTVAIVDTGVDYTHPDLTDQFGANKGDDPAGGDNDPRAPSGENHGTHVAGIASASTNNNTGIAGMSNSRLLACRVLGGGRGSVSDIAAGIRYATDNGADIINMSLGGGGYNDTMKNAVSYAVNNGALPICASGNDGSRGVSYPAKYDECMAVGAVDENEQLASFSQYGSDQDVVAPGVDVLSTWNDSPYNTISGTSMACPAASGVAALGLAADSSLGPNELRARLKNTAVDIGLSSDKQGAGRVDAANIVAAGDGGGGGNPPDNSAPSADISVDPTEPTVGETVTFDASGSTDSDGSIVSYDWDFGDGSGGSGEVTTHTYSDAGDYTVSVTVTDDDGATDTLSGTLSVQSGGGGGGGSCGDTSTGGSATSSLSGWWDSESYAYSAQLADPCQLVVSLDGPSRSDFDLYVTEDGRTPTTSDYDKRSITVDSQEQVLFENVSSGQEFGILVDSYSGSGRYTISVEELGK